MMNFYQKELIVESDLEWYFLHSDSQLTLQSNWNSMVNTAIYGAASSYNDNTSSYTLYAAHKKNEINKILNSISLKSRNVLYYSFSDVRYNLEIKKIFAKHTGAAVVNSSTKINNILICCQKLSEGKATPEDKLHLSKAKVEAENNYNTAINSYFHSKMNLLKST